MITMLFWNRSSRLLLIALCSACGVLGSSSKGEILAPENSSVSLFCKALFSTGSISDKAVWFKDGFKLGTVTKNSNLVIGGNYSDETVPEVGMLVLASVQRKDEGDYWCRTDTTLGDPNFIRVAFLDSNFHSAPEWQVVELNVNVQLNCSPPDGFPAPRLLWLKDGRKLPSNGRTFVFKDGTLGIYRFRATDAGRYTCVAWNIAGSKNVSAYVVPRIYFPAAKTRRMHLIVPPANRRLSYALWFLAGFASTAVVILLYALVAMCCLRPRRRLVQPVTFREPGMADGFRKCVNESVPLNGSVV